MNILVACKIVPDDQDIKAAPDGSLDFSKARMVISSYDKNAIEAAGMIADGGSVKAIAVGSSKADDSKVKKDILARGIDELFLVGDRRPLGFRRCGHRVTPSSTKGISTAENKLARRASSSKAAGEFRLWGRSRLT